MRRGRALIGFVFAVEQAPERHRLVLGLVVHAPARPPVVGHRAGGLVVEDEPVALLGAVGQLVLILAHMPAHRPVVVGEDQHRAADPGVDRDGRVGVRPDGHLAVVICPAMHLVHECDVVGDRRCVQAREVRFERRVLRAVEEREEPAARLRPRAQAHERRRQPAGGVRPAVPAAVEERREVPVFDIVVVERQQIVVACRAAFGRAVPVEE